MISEFCGLFWDIKTGFYCITARLVDFLPLVVSSIYVLKIVHRLLGDCHLKGAMNYDI